MIFEKVKKNIWNILIWGLVAFFTLLYFSLIFNRNVWTDEVFTFNLIKEDLSGIISGTAADVHPPLYYIYAKIFEVFWPQNIQAQKIAAIIPMVGTLAYMGYKGKKLFGDVATFFMILFLTCIPCTMEFAVQIRMYSLALLFVVVAGFAAYEVFTEGKLSSYIWLVIGSTAAAYTHYFAFVSICFINAVLFVFLLIKQRSKLGKWMISVIAMFVIYAPWMPSFINQFTLVRADYWIAPITLETIWSYFVWTFGLNLLPGFEYLYILLIACLIVLVAYSLVKKHKDEENDSEAIALQKKNCITALMSLAIPVLTVASGVIISMSKSPIYRDQYVMPSLGMLAVFVGIAVAVIYGNIRDNLKKNIFLVVIAAFLLLSGAVQYKECYRQEYKSTYIEKTLDWFENEVGENDYILYYYEPMGYVYKWYFPEDRLFYVQDFDLGCDYDAVWFLYCNSCWPITQGQLIDYNLWMEHMGLYGIEHAVFDIFKITHND